MLSSQNNATEWTTSLFGSFSYRCNTKKMFFLIEIQRRVTTYRETIDLNRNQCNKMDCIYCSAHIHRKQRAGKWNKQNLCALSNEIHSFIYSVIKVNIDVHTSTTARVIFRQTRKNVHFQQCKCALVWACARFTARIRNVFMCLYIECDIKTRKTRSM